MHLWESGRARHLAFKDVSTVSESGSPALYTATDGHAPRLLRSLSRLRKRAVHYARIWAEMESRKEVEKVCRDCVRPSSLELALRELGCKGGRRASVQFAVAGVVQHP